MALITLVYCVVYFFGVNGYKAFKNSKFNNKDYDKSSDEGGARRMRATSVDMKDCFISSPMHSNAKVVWSTFNNRRMMVATTKHEVLSDQFQANGDAMPW